MQSLFAKLMSDDPAFRARADRLVARAGDLSHSEAPAMRVALESARAGAPSGDFRAEAVIMLDLRPSLLVADASVEIPDDEEWRAAIGKAEPVVKALTPRVGHIRLSVFGVDNRLGA